MFIIPKNPQSSAGFHYLGHNRATDWNVTNFLNWVKTSSSRNYKYDQFDDLDKYSIQDFFIKNVLPDENNLDIQFFYEIKINDKLFKGYCYNYLNKNNLIIKNEFFDSINHLISPKKKKIHSLINNYILKKIESFILPQEKIYKYKGCDNKKIWLLDINKNNKQELKPNDIFKIINIDYINKTADVIFNKRKWIIESNDFYWINILCKKLKKK